MVKEKKKGFKIKKFIKSYDNFGTPIQFNNGHGNTNHGTLIGGLTTSFIYLFMFYFVTSKIVTMVTNNDQTNTRLTENLLTQELMLNESGYVPIIQLNYAVDLSTIPYDEKTKQYISLSAQMISVNGTENSTKELSFEDCQYKYF